MQSAYDYRFMLSDFGECRFRVKIGSELKGRAAPGTHTYGKILSYIHTIN